MKKSRKISKANIGSYDRARKGCIVIRVPDLARWFQEYVMRYGIFQERYVIADSLADAMQREVSK